MINQNIAHYRITGKLGQGGMGEVYRAMDTVLKRHVAIKVLPKSFAADSARLARFEREARVLAALNHPNIAVIYGIEQSVETHALIMELVEGETLAKRLERGPMTVPEALDCCRQIAEALEAAHEKGIIHRDLKPENVKITQDGRVKVLDFGLAKAVDGKPSFSATTVTRNFTRPGAFLGTPAYVSPEQAKGEPLDSRSDIWSFGCVLYECLTGESVFAGNSVTELIAAVIHTEPDWSRLPPDTPHAVRRLLKHCMARDTRRRLHHIADARLELEEVLSGNSGETATLSGQRRRYPWSVGKIATLCIVCILFGYLMTTFIRQITQPYRILDSGRVGPYQRKVYSIPLAEGTSLSLGNGNSITVSPEGERLVYVALDSNGVRRLYQREVADGGQPTVIAGTEHAFLPFFSSDGRWIWFFDRRNLIRVRVDGGLPEVIGGMTPQPKGATWMSDDLFLIATYFNVGLVAASPSELTESDFSKPDADHGEYGHLWPAALPDGRGVLFTAWDGYTMDNARTMVQWSDSGRKQELIPNSTAARYVPTGHVVFMRNGTLWGTPCDSTTSEFRVEADRAIPLIANMGCTFFGAGQFAFSRNGDLIYAESQSPQGLQRGQLVWVDLKGNVDPIPASDGYYDRNAAPRLSPDNKQVVVAHSDETNLSLMQDLDRGTFLPLTQLQGIEYHCAWIRRADQNWIIFANVPSGKLPDTWWQNVTTGEVSVLVKDELALAPYAYSSERDVLIYGGPRNLDSDIWCLRLFDFKNQTADFWPGDSQRNEGQAAFSPDSKFIAYVSEIADKLKVCVKPFTGVGQPLVVGSGKEPVWNPQNKSELFYRDGRFLVKAELQTEPNLKVLKTTPLFSDVFLTTELLYGSRCYDIANNGSQFLMVELLEEQAPPVTHLKVVVDWFTDLKEKCPPVGAN